MQTQLFKELSRIRHLVYTFCEAPPMPRTRPSGPDFPLLNLTPEGFADRTFVRTSKDAPVEPKGTVGSGQVTEILD